MQGRLTEIIGEVTELRDRAGEGTPRRVELAEAVLLLTRVQDKLTALPAEGARYPGDERQGTS